MRSSADGPRCALLATKEKDSASRDLADEVGRVWLGIMQVRDQGGAGDRNIPKTRAGQLSQEQTGASGSRGLRDLTKA